MAAWNRDWRALLTEAERQGFHRVATRNGAMYRSPDGRHAVTVHGTPSDYRALRNVVSQFRRAGLRHPDEYDRLTD